MPGHCKPTVVQMNRKIRNSLFKFHTWLGLHLSLFFTFMFLTGSLLVVGLLALLIYAVLKRRRRST